jgi:hypothetical protein
MRPSDGALLVRDYPGKVVRIACCHCDWTERYRRAGLAKRFGPTAGLPDVLDLLAADCPQHIRHFSEGMDFADHGHS